MVDVDGEVHVSTTQECAPVLEAVHAAADLPKDGPFRYNGSIPAVLAQQWATECKAGIGTAEFNRYAKRKLSDIDNRKLLVNRF